MKHVTKMYTILALMGTSLCMSEVHAAAATVVVEEQKRKMSSEQAAQHARRVAGAAKRPAAVGAAVQGQVPDVNTWSDKLFNGLPLTAEEEEERKKYDALLEHREREKQQHEGEELKAMFSLTSEQLKQKKAEQEAERVRAADLAALVRRLDSEQAALLREQQAEYADAIEKDRKNKESATAARLDRERSANAGDEVYQKAYLDRIKAARVAAQARLEQIVADQTAARARWQADDARLAAERAKELADRPAEEQRAAQEKAAKEAAEKVAREAKQKAEEAAKKIEDVTKKKAAEVDYKASPEGTFVIGMLTRAAQCSAANVVLSKVVTTASVLNTEEKSLESDKDKHALFMQHKQNRLDQLLPIYQTPLGELFRALQDAAQAQDARKQLAWSAPKSWYYRIRCMFYPKSYQTDLTEVVATWLHAHGDKNLAFLNLDPANSTSGDWNAGRNVFIPDIGQAGMDYISPFKQLVVETYLKQTRKDLHRSIKVWPKRVVSALVCAAASVYLYRNFDACVAQAQRTVARVRAWRILRHAPPLKPLKKSTALIKLAPAVKKLSNVSVKAQLVPLAQKQVSKASKLLSAAQKPTKALPVATFGAPCWYHALMNRCKSWFNPATTN